MSTQAKLDYADRMMRAINKFDSLDMEILTRLAMDHAEQLVESTAGRGDFTPAVFVVAQHGPDDPEENIVFVIDGPFNEWPEKSQAMRFAGRGLYTMQKIPLAAVLISKAFMAPESKGMPRDHPDRRDVAVVMGMSFSRKCHAMAHLDPTITPRVWSPIMTECESPLVAELFIGFNEAALNKKNPT